MGCDGNLRAALLVLKQDPASSPEAQMVKLGYKLMTEEHGPADLVRNAKRAEQAGFDFAAISDHYFPWLEEQGHAPFAWSVLGAVAEATEHLGLMTSVTCPIMRYPPRSSPRRRPPWACWPTDASRSAWARASG
jgi:hypothetical protein